MFYLNQVETCQQEKKEFNKSHHRVAFVCYNLVHMDSHEKIIADAVEYARAHKKQIAKELTDTNLFSPEDAPVAVFMSGSPGAGKTESSQRLIERFSLRGNGVLRIDSDELRSRFEFYDGTNSSLFQPATSIIADKIQDLAIQQHQSYVFDGTLTNVERARENILRCIGRGYSVHIIYVYQDPLQAWKFVKAREIRDGRLFPKRHLLNSILKRVKVLISSRKNLVSRLNCTLSLKTSMVLILNMKTILVRLTAMFLNYTLKTY